MGKDLLNYLTNQVQQNTIVSPTIVPREKNSSKQKSNNRKSQLATKEQLKHVVGGFEFVSWRRVINFILKAKRKSYLPAPSLILDGNFSFGLAGRSSSCSSALNGPLREFPPGSPVELRGSSAGLPLHFAR